MCWEAEMVCLLSVCEDVAKVKTLLWYSVLHEVKVRLPPIVYLNFLPSHFALQTAFMSFDLVHRMLSAC